MSLNRSKKYPGRFSLPTVDHPQGAFKNRSAPGAQDGSFCDQDWANDWDGFFARILNVANVTPNETIDSGTNSQLFDSLMSLVLRRQSPFADIKADNTIGEALTNLNIHTPQLRNGVTGVVSGSGWLMLPYQDAVFGATTAILQWKVVTVPRATGTNMMTQVFDWATPFPNACVFANATLKGTAFVNAATPVFAIENTSRTQFTAASGYSNSEASMFVWGIGR